MRRDLPLGAVSTLLVVQAVAVVGNWVLDPGPWSRVAAPAALLVLLALAVTLSIRQDRVDGVAVAGFWVTAVALGGELATHLLGTVPVLRDPGEELIRSLLILSTLVGSGYAGLGPRRGRTAALGVLGGWSIVTGLALRIDGIAPTSPAARPFVLALLVAAVTAALADAATHVAHRWAVEAQQARDVARLAFVDALTLLPNRRAAERELDRLPRITNAVVLVDLDHFKTINDVHGHDVGDTVLRLAARTMAAGLRASDTAARWGGEEFLVVLPATDAAGAAVVAERIRLALHTLGGPVPVTASFGVAAAEPHDDVREALRRADLALYEAKAQGRDRVAVAVGEERPGDLRLAAVVA